MFFSLIVHSLQWCEHVPYRYWQHDMHIVQFSLFIYINTTECTVHVLVEFLVSWIIQHIIGPLQSLLDLFHQTNLQTFWLLSHNLKIWWKVLAVSSWWWNIKVNSSHMGKYQCHCLLFLHVIIIFHACILNYRCVCMPQHVWKSMM